jgi:hypothetical protein
MAQPTMGKLKTASLPPFAKPAPGKFDSTLTSFSPRSSLNPGEATTRPFDPPTAPRAERDAPSPQLPQAMPPPFYPPPGSHAMHGTLPPQQRFPGGIAPPQLYQATPPPFNPLTGPHAMHGNLPPQQRFPNGAPPPYQYGAYGAPPPGFLPGPLQPSSPYNSGTQNGSQGNYPGAGGYAPPQPRCTDNKPPPSNLPNGARKQRWKDPAAYGFDRYWRCNKCHYLFRNDEGFFTVHIEACREWENEHKQAKPCTNDVFPPHWELAVEQFPLNTPKPGQNYVHDKPAAGCSSVESCSWGRGVMLRCAGEVKVDDFFFVRKVLQLCAGCRDGGRRLCTCSSVCFSRLVGCMLWGVMEETEGMGLA